jgi:hypothetical protein
MTPSVDTSDSQAVAEQQQVLEAFVVNNTDLEALEAQLEQFNIFEAIGVVRQELRHSDFLAFLLNPNQNHGLGDAFVRRFLQNVLITAQHRGPAISPIHLDVWDLSHLQVRREWRHADLLLVDATNHLVVLIENKIDSGEHSDQLTRYVRTVREDYPADAWQLLAIYLTPDGDEPSVLDYLPAAYRTVADTVASFVEIRSASLNPAVTALLVHYATMLRRHVVADSQIAELCRRIYQRHQRALDLIFEHRPDELAEIRAMLVGAVEGTPGLVLDGPSKQTVRFAPEVWERFPRGKGWTRSGRALLFEFAIQVNLIDLTLWLGPGPANFRQRVFTAARKHQPPFTIGRRKLSETYSSLYRTRLLKPEERLDAALDEIAEHIAQRWSMFVEHDLPRIVTVIQPDALRLTTVSDGLEAECDVAPMGDHEPDA